MVIWYGLGIISGLVTEGTFFPIDISEIDNMPRDHRGRDHRRRSETGHSLAIILGHLTYQFLSGAIICILQIVLWVSIDPVPGVYMIRDDICSVLRQFFFGVSLLALPKSCSYYR